MIVIVDERKLVTDGYSSLFDREGVASTGFASGEFGEWVSSAADEDLKSVRAFLIATASTIAYPRGPSATAPERPSSHSASITPWKTRCGSSNPASTTSSASPSTFAKFLARISAIRRRAQDEPKTTQIGKMCIFMDAETRRSTASRCRFRAASGASWNISQATAAAA